MYHKIAKYHEKKGNFDLAMESIYEAEKLENVRHRDLNVMITKANLFLQVGLYHQSYKLADQILHQDGKK